MWSRYDALSKFSFVPTVNPSTAYCVDAAVAFAHKTKEARSAVPAHTPTLDDDAIADVVAVQRSAISGQASYSRSGDG